MSSPENEHAAATRRSPRIRRSSVPALARGDGSPSCARVIPGGLPGKRRSRRHGRIGCMLRWLTAGESHGRALLAICEGVPAGVEVATADIAAALARRRAGYGRGARMKFEQDEVELTAGVRHGRTLGGPVAIRIDNTEWPKWETVMSPDPVPPRRASQPGAQRAADPAPARPRRPGRDAEVRLRRRARRAGAGQRAGDGGQGRARRGRPPVPAPGHRRRDRQSRGGHRRGQRPGRAASARRGTPSGSMPTRCAAWTRAASAAMRAEIDAARKDGDTLGGVVEVACLRAAAWAWAATCTGTAGWTAGWPGR